MEAARGRLRGPEKEKRAHGPEALLGGMSPSAVKSAPCMPGPGRQPAARLDVPSLTADSPLAVVRGPLITILTMR